MIQNKKATGVVSLLLSGVICLSLAGCAGKPNDPVLHTQLPSEVAGQEEESVTSKEIWNQVEAAIGELPKFLNADDKMASDFFGVNTEDLVDYVGKVPAASVHATEFFIAHVQPEKMDSVLNDLMKHADEVHAQWSQYLPDQLALVENYQLRTNGDYVFFGIAEKAEEALKAFAIALS